MTKSSIEQINTPLPESMTYDAVRDAGLIGYAGRFTELGGGELNDTMVLHCEARDVVMRISRNPGRNALRREERALRLLETVAGVPNLVFFDEEKQIDGRAWIMEEYLPGQHVGRLSIKQFQALGVLLAEIHKVKGDKVCLDPWSTTVNNCHRFGSESYLLAHPDPQLQKHFQLLRQRAGTLDIPPRMQCLRHCDITPSNTLVDGTHIALIDWELSGFGDPMSDFSTGYWSDMELNNGKWRQRLSDEERQALYGGYDMGGGTIDEHLVALYEFVDKVGVAAYLYWRLHVSDWKVRDGMYGQYGIDYVEILQSLEETDVNSL